MFAPVYLDFNATTQLDERVLEAMLPYLRARHGNPSSRHEYGRTARAAIDQARAQVAAAVNAHSTEVVFTSGGSEANNLFIKGAAATLPVGVIALGATEHPCVRQPALQLRSHGWQLAQLPLCRDGSLDVHAAAGLIEAQRPRLVSVMRANNETGTLNDVAALMPAARACGAWVHTDAVQALGKLPVDFRALGVHALSLSAHKVHGPLGAGALILDKRVELQPLIAGGGQERGLRSGTENLAAIVGFGRACELLAADMQARVATMRLTRDALEGGLLGLGAQIFGALGERLPNTSFFAFAGIDGETLVGKLDRAGFAVASGAACSSAHPEPARSLMAMGVAPEIARGAVRVSTGGSTTREEIARFLQVLQATLAQLRQMQALAH